VLVSNGSVASVSLADFAPQAGNNAYYYPTTTLGLTDRAVHYGEIYRRQLWVAVLVNKLAYSSARLPLKTYRRSAAGRVDARDTPLGRLLARPNNMHDPFFFWLWTASTHEIFGEAMWVKDRGGDPRRPPVNLWPLHPANVVTRRLTEADEHLAMGAPGDLIYERFAGVTSAPLARYRAADVVHFRSYNPDNQIRGMSRLEPLRQTLVNEDAARRATSSFWQRGARPGMALKHPGKFSNPDVAARLKAQFDAIAAGTDSTGTTVVLEEGMEAQVLSLSAEEAQYIETRKLNREEACAIYDVPPPAVHILDRATFSNITEQMRSMYRDTMAPRLGLYEAVLKSQLVDDFGDPDLYAEFLMDEVLRGSFEQRAQAYEVMTRIAGMTPAEVRESENRPFIPGTDRLFVNAATVPLDEASRNTHIAPETPKALHPDTIRTVMGRVSGKALATLDPSRLLAGLNGDTAPVTEALDAAVMAGDGPPEFHARLLAVGKEN
jgi:HK97 family phage portal protein